MSSFRKEFVKVSNVEAGLTSSMNKVCSKVSDSRIRKGWRSIVHPNDVLMVPLFVGASACSAAVALAGVVGYCNLVGYAYGLILASSTFSFVGVAALFAAYFCVCVYSSSRRMQTLCVRLAFLREGVDYTIDPSMSRDETTEYMKYVYAEEVASFKEELANA